MGHAMTPPSARNCDPLSRSSSLQPARSGTTACGLIANSNMPTG